MIPIKVNWEHVEVAFERNAPDLHSYIDRQTGDVVVAVDGRPEDDAARQMVSREPERFVKIEPASSREQYRWMEKFVATVDEVQLRDRLLIAIDGKGAFRRFKDVLLTFPQERERWFNYRARLLHHHINQWFETKGLDPDPPSPWGEVEPPPEPEQHEVRTQPTGQGPIDLLRLQVKSLVDGLPACELNTARAFLEFLRERGVTALIPREPSEDSEPVDRDTQQSLGEDDELDDDLDEEPQPKTARTPGEAEIAAQER